MTPVHVLTFTNLYPSARMPQHGLFVRERMTRLCRRNGWRLTVVAPLPRSLPLPGRAGKLFAVPAREQVDGVTVHHPRYLHVPRLSVRRQWRNMARGCRTLVQRLVRDEQVSLIDAHYLYPDACAAVALAQEVGVPCIATARGSDVNVLPQDPAIAATLRTWLPRARRRLAVSQALAARLAALLQVPTERIVVVPNGVDTERFHPGPQAAARAALGLPGSGRLVLAVGRMVPIKRFDLLLRAFAALPGADVRLAIVGDGPERAALTALMASLGVTDRVILLGERPPQQVAEAMRAADLFALTSDNEGWPNVVMEALAAGLPVVARAVGGVPEIVTAAQGQLVAEGTPAAFGAALARELATRRDPAASVARAVALGWERTLARLTEVVQEALAS